MPRSGQRYHEAGETPESCAAQPHPSNHPHPILTSRTRTTSSRSRASSDSDTEGERPSFSSFSSATSLEVERPTFMSSFDDTDMDMNSLACIWTHEAKSNIMADRTQFPTVVVLLRVVFLSGENAFEPMYVSSARKIKSFAELLHPPKGHETVWLHGEMPLYDTEQTLASLLDHNTSVDKIASLDLNVVWRRKLRKGDRVIVHEDIPDCNLKSGQRGRVSKILRRTQDSDRTRGRGLNPTKWRNDGDALISFRSGGNVWVDRHSLCKLHVHTDDSSVENR